jgi:hypothetical protein
MVGSAAVRATSRVNNRSVSVKTTADGVYTIPYLEPGVYDVEVTAPGFRNVKLTAVELQTQQRLNLPVRMTLGEAKAQVTVEARQELIDSTDSNRGLVFDPLKTQEMPLNGRQAYMLLTLTPGVIFTQEQFGASGFSGTRGWDVNSNFKFNGARSGNGNNIFLMNGSPVSNEGSTWEFSPTIDSIQEFKAITTAFDAQYGHEAGGIVNTTIKSGTNKWHGDVYDYFRNRVLDANSFQNNVAGLGKGRHNQNQFGGVIGGPIRKNKDFLFAGYEGWQEVVPFPAQGTTVPVDLRNGQNFSNYQITIYDPLTTHACGASNEQCSQSPYWRNVFPGDVIPATRLSPVGQKILSYLPAPNSPGTGAGGITNNFVANFNEGRYWYNQPLVRWDHVFSDKDKFTAMYTNFHGYEFRSTAGFAKPVATGNTDNERTFNGINLDETHVLSSTAVLDVRGNFMRFTQLSPGYNNQALGITAQSVGMTDMIHAPTVAAGVIPNINITGIANTSSTTSNPLFGSGSYSWSPYTSWDLTPNVTWVRGKHTLHIGFEYRYEARGNVSLGNAYGSFTFNSNFTRQASGRSLVATDAFDSIASVLLGIPDSGNIDNNATSYNTRQYYAGYLQDDWKVNSRLALNLGVRYEVQLPYLERYNRMDSVFNVNVTNPLNDQVLAAWNTAKQAYDANPANKYPYPAAPAAILGGYQFAGQNGLPRRQFYPDWTTLAPRAGFAYRMGDKTALRGGVGVYYQSMTQTGAPQTGFSASTPYLNSLDGGVTPSACANGGCAGSTPSGPYSLVNPFPNGLQAAPGSSLGYLTNIGNSVGNINNLTYKIPRTYQYSLGIQRQLPWDMVIDVAFGGNFAGNTPYSMDMNWPQDAAGVALYQQAIADPNFFSRQVANPFLGIVPATSSLGSAKTISADKLMGNFPLWNGSASNNSTVQNGNIARGTFRSDAGQLRLEKRAFGKSEKSFGVMTWVLAYTFSKQYALLCCTSGFSWMTGDKNMRYQLDSNNKTQEMNLHGIWDVPFGKGQRFGASVHGVAGKLASGWRVDYILSYISGFPVGLPNLINSCGRWENGDAQNQYHWFNNDPSCYTQFPANAGGFSYLPPRFSGNVNNPAKPQLNLAIEKNTSLGEHYTLKFRAESFNLTNTPIRPGPSTTFPGTTFGVLPASQQNFPRLVQLALKLDF